ncbi:MAG: 50S ribosomal protein L29 [Chloroflexota bacterium]|nr:50S ribosomal protein L29 [Chloroflexota bacterium]
MKASEIRAMTSEEIQREILDTQEELMNLRFQKEIDQLTDSSLLGELRRNVARMKTVLRERELWGEL